MSKKPAKTALNKEKVKFVRACPACGEAMVATKVIRSEARPGGMYWVCPQDDNHIRVGA